MRVRAVMIRILRQLGHDKRTIALMILAPMLVMTLMSVIFNGTEYHPKIGVINAPSAIMDKLIDNDAQITSYGQDRTSEAQDALAASDIDAIIDIQGSDVKIQLEGSDPKKNAAVIKLMQGAMQTMSPAVTVQPDITYLYGYEDMSSFDNFGPILIGFFVFFFVFLVAGVSFLSERDTGTLERILATPLRRWELVMGYILGFGAFTIIQSALIAWYSIHILNVMMVGSFLLVLVITILTAMVALTIGTFISAFADSELQMIQFIPLIIVPQVFFSGLFDLSTMTPWLQYLGRFMPLWYAADALRNIMIRGKGWSNIMLDILVLIAFFIFFTVANILALKKHRRI